MSRRNGLIPVKARGLGGRAGLAGGWLLASFGCLAPDAIDGPLGLESGVLLGQSTQGLIALKVEAGKGRWVGEAVEPLLWAEYSAGAVDAFWDPQGALIFPGASPGPDRSDAPRLLPDPTMIQVFDGRGWAAVSLEEARRRTVLGDFRLPAIDPFQCAAWGGCYVTVASEQRLTCGPCPAPPAIPPPTPPAAPVLTPCPGGWTEGEVAGVVACLPPPPCDPDRPPADGGCALARPCPGRSVEALGALVAVDPDDCPRPGVYCSLAEAVAALEGTTTSATIALGGGLHRLNRAPDFQALNLVGLCPAASVLEVDLLAPVTRPARWRFRDLSLEAASAQGPVTLTLLGVENRADATELEVNALVVQDGVWSGRRARLTGSAVELTKVVAKGVAFELHGPARVEDSALTRGGLQTWDDLQVERSLLELTATGTTCHGPGPTTRWVWRDVVVESEEALALGLGRCSFDVERLLWRGRGATDSSGTRIYGLGDAQLKDVVIELNGRVGTLASWLGTTRIERLRLLGAIEQVFDLNRGAGAELRDLDLTSTLAAFSEARTPEVVTLKASMVNDVSRVRMRAFPSVGVVVKNDIRDPRGPLGTTRITDLDLEGLTQGGLLAQATALELERLRMQRCSGAGVGLSFSASGDLQDLEIREHRAVMAGCSLASPGPTCLGAALFAGLDAHLEVRRFSLQAPIGVALAEATGRARDGALDVELGFDLGEAPQEDLRVLLEGVQVQARQVVSRAK